MTRVAVAAAVVLLCAGDAHAQASLGRPLPAMPSLSRDSADTEKAASPRRGDREGPSIVARGDPRSFQVVSVGVPAAFPSEKPVGFVVNAAGGVPVMGPREGTLEPVAGEKRSVVLTVGVPSKALAGRRAAAVVTFTAPGFASVDVPVDLDVAPVRGLAIVADQPLRGARAGQRVTIAYKLTNTGNATDSLTLRVDVPDGWRMHRPRAGGSVRLAVGAAAVHRVQFSIPSSYPAGPATVRLVAMHGLVVRGRASTTIEVVGSGNDGGAGAPELTAGVASVVAGARHPQSAVALGITGPLTPHVQMQGQLTVAPGLDGTNGRALARVGYFPSANYLTLSSPTWKLSLGIAGLSISELAGTNVWGQGAAFQLTGARWRTTSVVAQPTTGGGSGELLAGQVGHKVGATWVTSSVSHLRDAQSGSRRLDALAVGAEVPLHSLGDLSAELAGRHYAGGSGVGVTTELRRDDERGSLQVRLTHAPGGSAAFARATDEYSANVSRELAEKVSVSASGWSAYDANPTFQRLGSRGWSVAPQYQLSRSTAVQLEARGSSFDATSASGRFGSGQTTAGLRLNYFRGVFFASADGSFGSLTRIARPSSGGTFDNSAPHSTLRGAAGYGTTRGRFDISGSIEQTGDAAGLTPRQSMLSLQAERVVPLASKPWLTVNGQLQRFGWFGDRAGLYLFRTGLEADLAHGFRLVLDAEHNALFRSPTASGAWTAVLKVERATALSALSRARTAGVVYQDLNANGQRDPDEPGFQGAVVRRDGQVSVTDGRGRYRLAGDGRGAQLDPRSLPPGWMTSGSAATATMTRGDIGVLPTAALEVRLMVAPDAEGRAASISLGPTSVIVRDSAGRSWTARASTAGVASFDALPLGSYRLELEMPLSSEPLRMPSPLPAVRLITPRGVSRVTIPLGLRPLKIWRPGEEPAGGEANAASLPRHERAAAEQTASPQAALHLSAPASAATPAASQLMLAAIATDMSGGTGATSGGRRPSIVLGEYVVRPRDTLSRLALRFLGDQMQWPLLYDVNRARLEDPDHLTIGQRLAMITFQKDAPKWHSDSSTLFGRRVRLTPAP